MERFTYIQNCPARYAVFKRDGFDGYYGRLQNIDPRTKEWLPTYTEFQLSGITHDLRTIFYPDYLPLAVSKADKQPTTINPKKKKKKKNNATITTTASSSERYNGPSTTLHQRRPAGWGGRRSLRLAQAMGKSLGKLIHEQMALWTNTMQFAKYGWQNYAIRCEIFENQCSRDLQGYHKKTKLATNAHPCVAALIDKMNREWNWWSIASEFLVGDIRGRRKYATQIDMICVNNKTRDEQTRGKLIFVELKSGSNFGRFQQGNAVLKHSPIDPRTKLPKIVYRNSPVHQAKLQLVLGAVMLLQTVGLSWNDVELWVVHTPTQPTTVAAGTTEERVFYDVQRSLVTEQEREDMLVLLKTQNFIL